MYAKPVDQARGSRWRRRDRGRWGLGSVEGRLAIANREVSSIAAERCQPANRARRSRVCSEKAVLEWSSEAY